MFEGILYYCIARHNDFTLTELTFAQFNGFLTVHHSVELKFTTNLMHNFYLFNNNIIS
jgi:hypothetical protein